MQRKNAVDWSKYLQPGEQIQDVPAATLRKRRHDSLGGVSTSKTEKARLNRLEAKLKENAIIGREMDVALDQLTDSLTQLANTYNRADRRACLDMIWFGKEILRAFNYQKEPVHDENVEEVWNAERDLPYEEQAHMGHFVGNQTSEFIFFARSAHLQPEFIKFEVDVLSAVLAWADAHPDNFVYRKEIEQELKARLDGRDTAFQRPATPVSLPLQTEPPKNYQTAEDILVAPTPPTMQELAIKSFLENRSWVDGEEIT